MAIVKVEVNGMLYEDYHPKCKCIRASTDTGVYAFLQVLDQNTGMVKRYWGRFDVENPESSIRRIMSHGGKWPSLPEGDELLDN